MGREWWRFVESKSCGENCEGDREGWGENGGDLLKVRDVERMVRGIEQKLLGWSAVVDMVEEMVVPTEGVVEGVLGIYIIKVYIFMININKILRFCAFK